MPGIDRKTERSSLKAVIKMEEYWTADNLNRREKLQSEKIGK